MQHTCLPCSSGAVALAVVVEHGDTLLGILQVVAQALLVEELEH